ncbi:MAG: DUF4282 domain-containing protein [Caldisericia bacterium]|nr:DUF4282 domain-containing protein [Caldisericia bacterium]
MDELTDDLKNDLKNDFKKVNTPKAWLSFDKMITPVIIKFFFWLGVVSSVIIGLIAIFSSIGRSGAFMSILGGLLIIVLGPILARVYCELIIVIFKIHESLVDIKNNTEK